MIMHRITHHQRTQLFFRSSQSEPAPDRRSRQCRGEGVVRDRPGRAAKCHSECKAGLEEAGFSLLHVLLSMKKLIKTGDKKKISI